MVEGSQIIDAGHQDDMLAKYPSYEKIGGRGRLMMPALVNSHTHLPMTLLRSLCPIIDMQEWFDKVVYPRERVLDRRMVEIGAKVALAEMALDGVCGFVDMYFMEDAVIKAGQTVGLKGVYTYGLVDNGSEEKAEKELATARSLYKLVHELGRPDVKTAIAPHSIYTCSPELLRKAAQLAAELSLPLHIHLAERADEGKLAERNFGTRFTGYADYVSSLGMMASNLLCFHGTHLTRRDVEMFRRAGSQVVVNPTSNMRLKNGAPPMGLLADGKVLFGLGTDGACSNDEQSVLRELKVAALVSGLTGSSTIDEWTLLKAATSPMSTLFGDTVGLGKGCKANIALYKMSLGFNGVGDPAKGVIFSPGGLRCEHLLVDGKDVVRQFSLVNVSADSLIEDYNSAVRALESKVGG
ncbi:MAG: amidohydrolase family protein [Thermoprotei archaeon]